MALLILILKKAMNDNKRKGIKFQEGDRVFVEYLEGKMTVRNGKNKVKFNVIRPDKGK